MIWSSHGAIRPRRMIVLAIAALVPLLAGCEAGNNAPTNSWHQPTEGASQTLGDIAISNVFVLGPGIGGTIGSGQSASLFFAIVNSGPPDKLVSITAPGEAASVTLPDNAISLATNQAVLLTGPTPKATLNGIIRPLSGSSVVTLVLTFQNAGSVTLAVPVVPMASYFATYSPAPFPTPTKKQKKPKPVTSTASPVSSGSAAPGSTPPAATPSPTPTS